MLAGLFENGLVEGLWNEQVAALFCFAQGFRELI
jgi:hypothetical protein